MEKHRANLGSLNAHAFAVRLVMQKTIPATQFPVAIYFGPGQSHCVASRTP